SYIQRQRGSGLAGVQRKSADELCRQHGYLQAGNVDRGHAGTGQLVEFAVAGNGQSGRGNVYAYRGEVAVLPRHGQRIVDLDGAAVVHGIGRDIGQRQVRAHAAELHRRELRSLGKIGGHEAVLVQRQGMWPGAQRQQQLLGTGAQRAHGRVERLPFHGVLVRPGQQRLGDRRDLRRQRAGDHLVGPRLLQGGLLLFLLDRRQGRGKNVGRGGAVAALAAPVEIGGRAVQRENDGGLFDRAGRVAEIILRECGGVELLLRSAFPKEIDFKGQGKRLPLFQQGRRGRLLETEQYAGVLDLAALA